MQYQEPEKTIPNLLNEFEKLVFENLSNINLTNKDLAFQLAVSERNLYRNIQRLTGFSPNHYIRKIRLNEAYQMLISGRYSTVKEVVGKVGFQKGEYFSKLFKAEFGITPVEILRNTN